MDHPTANATNLTANRTALVLIPPKEFAERLNQFRLVHDKSSPRWTAHITLHFSFTEVPHFPEAVATIERELSRIEPFSFKFDGTGSFALQGYDNVHLTVSDDSNIQRIWSVIAKALNYSGRPLTPHLTVGQAAHGNPEAMVFLRRKAERLLDSVRELEWPVRSVVFLRKDEDDNGVMKRCHEVYLAGESESSFVLAPAHPTVVHDGTEWQFCDSPPPVVEALPSTVTIATYNILHDDLFSTSKRLPSIIRTIMSSNADVICLQEVADDSLSSILSSPLIFSQFPFSGRHPHVVLENERNILLLSRFPFSWTKLDIGGKHKPALIATFRNRDLSRSLILAATHLTAGRTGSYLSQKTLELETLVNHMYDSYPDDDWVFAGDMNWPENARVTPADDLFEDAGLVVPHPPTYDPKTNSLASATARESTDPQRFDRVYVKRMGGWDVASTRVFGNVEDPPSDHYGLAVVLQRHITPEKTTVSASESTPHLPRPPLPVTGNLTNEDLVDLFATQSWLPSQDQEHRMSLVIDTLRSVICPPTTSNNVQIRIECVGSYALGVHTSHSDVDCLAVGNVSSTTFWDLAKSRIRQNTAARKKGRGVDVRLRRFVKDAIVQRMDLEVEGVRVDMQYCPAKNLIGDEWKNIASLPSDSPLFLLPASSLVTLNAYRDVLTIRKLLQQQHPSLLDAFRIAHRSIKLYLTAQGLFGGRFGFLGGFHLTLLLTRVALTLVPPGSGISANEETTSELVEPKHLVRQFLQTYSKWDWERDVVWAIPSLEPDSATSTTTTQTGYRRSPNKEPMVVLSIERPLSNLTFHASRNSVEVMRRAFGRAEEMIGEGKRWGDVCGVGKEVEPLHPQQVFLKEYKIFIKLDVHFWGGSNLKGRAVVGWLESRIVNLLVQLHGVAPGINARFWPTRFADSGTIDVDGGARDLNGFYLFGLSPSSSTSPPATSPPSQPTLEAELAALSQCLRGFETDLQSNDKFYDSQNTYISLRLVKRSTLGKEVGLSSIVKDPFMWSDDGFDPVDDDDDEDDEGEVEERDEDDSEPQLSRDREYQIQSASQRKKAIAASKANKNTTYTPSPGKLRTSADVINRLLWDPDLGKHAGDEYAVGYEDRFMGVKEAMLRDWVMKEVEHEAFIPQHRIVYFKRVADDEIVWDRKKKIDLVFGSGVGAGNSV